MGFSVSMGFFEPPKRVSFDLGILRFVCLMFCLFWVSLSSLFKDFVSKLV